MLNLNFDPATHSYTLGDRKLISVTQCLSILDNRWKVDPWYLERGRLIHLATQYYDWDELDESSVDENIRPYFDAYVKFKEETDFVPTFIERKLYHPRYMYGMTIDRIGYLNDRLVMIDLKSGAPAKVDELQGVAYLEGCLANGIEVKAGFDLYLHDDGTYKLEPIKNPKLLLPVFLACLTTMRWKEGL
jgi:hypothetical protein